jgi:hypothetical protein
MTGGESQQSAMQIPNEAARVYRPEAAHRSDLMAPTLPI